MDQILLFGDSLTQQCFTQERGFAMGAALADAYIRRLDVVNRGFSGFNTVQGLHVLEQSIPSPAAARLRFLTIWFGANDSRLPNTPDFPQHVPLPEFVENLRKMVNHPRVKAHKDVRIIVITPPTLEETIQERGDRAEYADMTTLRRTAIGFATYAKAVRELAAELGLTCLDLWTVMVKKAGGDPNGDWSKLPGTKSLGENKILAGLQRDGLHFTPAGYKLAYDELMALIARTWPDQIPDALPYVQPKWDDVAAWKGIYP